MREQKFWIEDFFSLISSGKMLFNVVFFPYVCLQGQISELLICLTSLSGVHFDSEECLSLLKCWIFCRAGGHWKNKIYLILCHRNVHGNTGWQITNYQDFDQISHNFRKLWTLSFFLPECTHIFTLC